MGNFHTCEHHYCDNKIKLIKGISKDKLNYCFMHKCTLNTCAEKRIETSFYCKYHKCSNFNCDKQAYTGGYCSGCFLPRTK